MAEEQKENAGGKIQSEQKGIVFHAHHGKGAADIGYGIEQADSVEEPVLKGEAPGITEERR